VSLATVRGVIALQISIRRRVRKRMEGFIILSTMHVQDLKDIEGDRARNQKTFPLVSQKISRWSIIISVLY
jgi:hypothetical protein